MGGDVVSMVRGRAHVVVLGAGYAGIMAANRLRMAAPEAQVTLISPEAALTHRIAQHRLLGEERAAVIPLQKLLAARVAHVVGWAERIDVARGEVVLGGAVRVPYDQLIVATGSSTATPGIEGASAHVLTLEALASDAEARAALRRRRAGEVVHVVGGGLTGLEVATSLAVARGGGVRLVTRGPLGAGALEVASQAVVRARLEALGVEVLDDPRLGIEGVSADALHTTDGALPHAWCVWTAGMRASGLAEASGLTVDRSGRMICHPSTRSVDAPNVWGAGDAALIAGLSDGAQVMGCAAAMPAGAHAAAQVARVLRGEAPQAHDLGVMLRCVGLGPGAALVQGTLTDGTPTRALATGRTGALVKAGILRMVTDALRAERALGVALYRWPHRSAPTPSPAPSSARV